MNPTSQTSKRTRGTPGVVVVDARPAIAERIASLLGTRCEAWRDQRRELRAAGAVVLAPGVTWCADVNGAREALLAHEAALVLVGTLDGDDHRGAAALEIAGAAPERPVLALHDGTDPDDGALPPGAAGWLPLEGLTGPLLTRLLDGVVARRRLEDELALVRNQLRLAHAQLAKFAQIDPLTSLLNRRGLQQVLSRVLHWARHDGTPTAAMLVDLDDFRDVNETLGHGVGDVLLRETARVLRESLRSGDYAARIGGDEFLVLMPRTDVREGRAVAERTRLCLSSSPLTIDGRKVHATASIGLAEVSHGTPSVDELLAQCRLVVRDGKASGKNRVASDADRSNEPRDESERERFLTAFRSGATLRAVKQSIHDLTDESVTGYEFLSRADCPPFSMPQDFFRLCFENNLLTLVDHQCFRRGLEAAGRLAADVHCHLNLFPSTMIDVPTAHLLDSLPAGRNPEQYCIEISEQQIIGDPSYLAEPVARLRERGVKIAIDDVGFGRSCLESLALLEPDIVKIDRRCVSGVGAAKDKRRVLERLLRVANALGSQVVAEGIETRDDLAALVDLGVTQGQGFLWGRPA
jgi:diguanylate cyclase (GGDEF)-like protein